MHYCVGPCTELDKYSCKRSFNGVPCTSNDHSVLKGDHCSYDSSVGSFQEVEVGSFHAF